MVKADNKAVGEKVTDVRAPPLKYGEHHAETCVDDGDQPPPDWTKTKADWEWEQVCHSICQCREQKATTFMLIISNGCLPVRLNYEDEALSLSDYSFALHLFGDTGLTGSSLPHTGHSEERRARGA